MASLTGCEDKRKPQTFFWLRKERFTYSYTITLKIVYLASSAKISFKKIVWGLSPKKKNSLASAYFTSILTVLFLEVLERIGGFST